MFLRKALFIACALRLLAASSSAQVVLSEVVSFNGPAGFLSADGFGYDWIELQNTGASDVDLIDHYLTDDSAVPTVWKFTESFIVPAGGFRVVFASDRNGFFDGEAHLNFKLSSSNGEYLALIGTDGISVISEIAPGFPPLPQYVAHGRVSGTNTLNVLLNSTPLSTNSAAAPAPAITSFTASETTIDPGESIDLNWNTENGTLVRLWSRPPFSSNFVLIMDNLPATGTATFSPTLDVAYRITVQNQYGNRESIIEVGITPQILAFSATPSTIVTGGLTVLRWQATGTNVSVSVDDPINDITSSPLLFYPWNHVIVPKGDSWKIQTVYPGLDWRDPAFDDAAWPVSSGPFTQISYLRKTFELSDVNAYTNYTLRGGRNQRYDIWINGHPILAYDSFSSSRRQFKIDPSVLKNGTNLITVEYKSGDFDFDMVAWEPQATATIVPLTLTATNPHGSSTITLNLSVLPEDFAAPALPPIVFSEFYWSYAGTAIPEPYRFVEIHNRSSNSIDLSGTQLIGSAIFEFSSANPSVLAPDAHSLVVADLDTFASQWPGIRPVVGLFENPEPEGTYNFDLDIALLDPFGRSFERFDINGFDSGLYNAQNQPVERIDESTPPVYPDNWKLPEQYEGTPGEASFEFIHFTASPSSAAPGDTITLSWEVSRNVPMTISHGIGAVSGTSGSVPYTIPLDTTQLRLTLSAQLTFSVQGIDTNVLLPPVITSFQSDKSSISIGESVNLTWTYQTNSGYISSTAYPEAGPVSLYDEIAFAPTIGGLTRNSNWRLYTNGSNVPSDWRSIEFDDRNSGFGSGIFGYGNGNENRVLQKGNWITSYFRRDFYVDQTTDINDLSLDILFDDAAEVYINGTEVLRENLPAGIITSATPAIAPTPDDGMSYQTFTLDPNILVEGNNVLAVGIHNVAANDEDLSFDLGLRAPKPVPASNRRTYTLTASNDAGSASAQLTILFDGIPTDIQSWQLAQSLTGDPFITDSDEDGLSDAIEYLTASDPHAASPNPLQAGMDESGYLVLSFPCDLHAGDFILSLKTSTDLTTWTTVGNNFVFVSALAPDDSSVSTKIYRSYAPATGGPRYFRLSARLAQ
jgi:hypothetical protein